MTMSRTARVGRAASDTSSKAGSTTGKTPNDTIECLLNLRSVRDQLKDAKLDLSNDKVAHQLEELEERLVDHLAEERDLRDGVGLLTVAVVGDFNSGKSTFINALIGKKVCPVGDEPTTASVTHFIHGDKQRFELVRDGVRTSIDRGKYLSMVRHSKVGDRKAYVFHVSVNSPLLEHIRLVDTPGFSAPPPNTKDTKVTAEAVATADALFVIADARKGNPSRTVLEQLNSLRNTRRNESVPPAFLLLNKAERLPPSQRNEVKSVCKKQYGGRFRNVTLISALRLNDVEDAAPLGALDTITRRIRAALSRQKSFEARLSARVVTEGGQENYRIDIDGNEYEASVSSDDELGSREELAVMVRSVASERRALLETQFWRRTSELRRDWLKVASGLEGLCRRATMARVGAGNATDGRGKEALMAIDDAKDRILDRVHTIFLEVVEEEVSKEITEKLGIWSSKTVYHVDVRVDKAYDVAATHDHWGKIKTIVKNLISSLKRIQLIGDVGTIRNPDEIARGLRDHGLEIVRESLEDHWKRFRKRAGWGLQPGNRWRREFEEEAPRNECFNELCSAYRSGAYRLAGDFAQYLQRTIDTLQEAVIRFQERGHAAIRERDDELTKLRERVSELVEYTP